MERIQAAIQKAKEKRSDAAGVAFAPSPSRPAGRAAAQDEAVRAAWDQIPPFVPDPVRMRRERVVSFERSDPSHLTFDMLRTKVLRQMSEKGWTSLAITSPSSGCGKTMVSLNLAFSLAQQRDSRTVLMDLDLRRPALAKALGLRDMNHSIEELLQGDGALDRHFVRYGDGLAIGGNAMPARNPAELLHHPSTGQALAGLQAMLRPRVMLYDTPPMLTCDDMMALVPNVDCVLLVAGAGVSTIDEIDRCERDLDEQTNVLGVILNKCRYSNEDYNYYS